LLNPAVMDKRKEQENELKWTPKTGQPTKLLLAVQEGGDHGAETEVA
jgi:hypothetical protein